MRRLAVLALLLGLTAVSSTALAQCTNWLPASLSGPGYGTDGEIRSFFQWDPDGAGPDPTWLIVGGSFSHVDGVPANNIAAWDGWVWRALGSGTNGPVDCFTTFGGALIVGGEFDNAGGVAVRSVARYANSAWSAMGGGLYTTGAVAPAPVQTLAVYNGGLYAGGNFLGPAMRFARWNGANWISQGIGFEDQVTSMAVYGGYLVVGGYFFHPVGMPSSSLALVRYDGSNWTVFPDNGSTNSPYHIIAMSVVGGTLYTACETLVNNGSAKITGYNGSSWQPVTGGPCYPQSLCDRGGTLYAGGYCCPGAPANMRRVQYYAAGQWQSIGGGLGPDCSSGSGDQTVFALTEYNGLMYAGGRFQRTDGDFTVNIARWEGVSWEVPKAYSWVTALATTGSTTWFGGPFSTNTLTGWGYFLATATSQGISRFDGPNAPVYALYSYTDTSPPNHQQLIVGGGFTRAGTLTASNVARLDIDPNGSGTWVAMGSSLNSTVLALERYRGKIVAGGLFTATGVTPVTRVARWDGTAWTAMGTGMNGAVRALKAYTDRDLNRAVLVAAGDFTTANGGAASHIAGWSESLTGGITFPWGPFGNGFNGQVSALEYYNNSLYAAGSFTASGATTLNKIARSTTGGWVPVGTATPGGGLNGNVTALKVINGSLYATGWFTSADGVPAYRIARWDGTTWSAVSGGGTTGAIMSIVQQGSEIYTGGEFDQAGSSSTWSLARYTSTGIPWFTSHPSPVSAPVFSFANFHAVVAGGYSGVTYRWQRDGVPLTDGMTPQGSTLAGVTTPDLSITRITLPDSGDYSCAITNTCGGTTSAPAHLSVMNVTGVGDGSPAGPLELSVLASTTGSGSRLAWNLPTAGPARLEVFDIQGRRVATLINGTQEAGRHETEWNGGGRVSPGIYYARLTFDGRSLTRKVLMLRS